jgi:hypothetical protein
MIDGLEHELGPEDVDHPGAVMMSGYSITGIVLGIVGLILMMVGYLSSGSPKYSDTLNIGLLTDKIILATVGGFTTVCATLLYIYGAWSSSDDPKS